MLINCVFGHTKNVVLACYHLCSWNHMEGHKCWAQCKKWIAVSNLPLAFIFLIFFSTPFPFLCLQGLTIQTPYSQTIKTQHLLMVALTSVPLEYNNIIPFSYSPLKPSRFCSAVVAPAFYSWKHASYFLWLGSLSLFICSSSNSLFLSLSSYSF